MSLIHTCRLARAKMAEFLAGFVSIPFDDAAAEKAGALRAGLASSGTPTGPYDAQIAAIALSRGLTVVTHNTREFARVEGLRWEDWQAAPAIF
jgi:tRNA(fMet)-specific endonuclease VapC